MVRLFRSFSWAALLPLLALAMGLRAWSAAATGGHLGGLTAHLTLGAWDGLLPAGWSAAAGAVASAVPVVLVGFFAAASLQAYRLATAGTLPAYLTLVLGSALWPWVTPDGSLWAALALAAAAHQLYGAYRHQGASLPVFNAGFYVGLAWLLSAPAVWFAGWALVVLAQLRKARGGDFLGLLFGVVALPGLYLMYAYVFGDFAEAATALLRGAATLPTGEGLRQNAVPLAVLAVASALALSAFGSLAGRRPVPEQRAHRMYYTMLVFGWVATLLSVPEVGAAYTPAFLLLPLGVLLGVYLVEVGGRAANVFLVGATVAVVAGVMWGMMSS